MKCQSYALSTFILLTSIADFHTRNMQALYKECGGGSTSPTQLKYLKGNLNLQLYPFPIMLDIQNIEQK